MSVFFYSKFEKFWAKQPFKIPLDVMILGYNFKGDTILTVQWDKQWKGMVMDKKITVLTARENKRRVNSIPALGSSASQEGLCEGSNAGSECCWELNMAALLSHKENKFVAIVALCQSIFLKYWDRV